MLQRLIDAANLDASPDARSAKPPIHKWDPQVLISNDMRIDTQGNWYHEGEAIERLELCQLFASILRKEGNDYFLITPREKFPIVVDDVPYTLNAVYQEERDGHSVLRFITNLNESIVLDDTHHFELRNYQDVPVPYVQIRHELYARISRNCFYELCDFAKSEPHNEDIHWTIESNGQSFVVAVEDKA